MPGRLEPEVIDRRDFLGLAGTWTALAAIAGSVIGMMRMPKPSILPEAGSKVPIGRPEDFPPGTIHVVPDRHFMVMSRASGLVAISLICTHLGCIVAKTNKGFACPCHGSRFGPDGKVTGGPAPRALHWLEITQAVDGRLVVDVKQDVPLGTFFRV